MWVGCSASVPVWTEHAPRATPRVFKGSKHRPGATPRVFKNYICILESFSLHLQKLWGYRRIEIPYRNVDPLSNFFQKWVKIGRFGKNSIFWTSDCVLSTGWRMAGLISINRELSGLILMRKLGLMRIWGEMAGVWKLFINFAGWNFWVSFFSVNNL